MSFFIVIEDSSVIVTHALYKTAVLIAVLRWILSWILRYRSRSGSKPCPSLSSEAIKSSLALTTYGDVAERLSGISDTCAVCLSRMEDEDEVRELVNCRHVFHRDCIDRWVDYDGDDHRDHHDCVDEDEDNHRKCPLCRTSLLATTSLLSLPVNSEPSWACERLLYLFGDDLLA